MFIWNENDLNDEQKTAIVEEGSILLEACPGSGKTRTLTYKIAYELSRLESSKKYVIAITYTHVAADEIKERVELLGVNTQQLWIGTIHSFCLEWVLKPYFLYEDDLKFGFKIINSHDSEEIISDLCKPFNNPRITYWDCGYQATVDSYEISCTDERKRDGVNKILTEYFDIINENNQIDFEQILFYSFQILKKRKTISSILSNLFTNILIDEYQDTKRIQYEIICSIARASQGEINMFIVGDSNQSIFDSLGGFPMSIHNLEALTVTSFKHRFLTKNYRSSSKIIQYFDHFKTYTSTIEGIGEHSNYDSKITYNTEIRREELEEELVRLINFNVENEGISPEEICIVAPQWVHLASITRKLMIRLPDFSFNGPGMAPFSRDIDNFWYKLSRIILTEPSPKMYVRRLRWSQEVLEDLKFSGYERLHLTNKSFLKLCNSIIIVEDQGLVYLKKFFREILIRMDLDIDSYIYLKEHFISFFESSGKRIERLMKEGNESIGSIENFRKVFKQKDGITISTIHGVKGTEFDAVIAFALLEGYLPHFNDKNAQVNSKKMLYVVSSRARKNLHLLSEKERFKPFGSPPDEYLPTSQLAKYSFQYSNE